MAFDPPAPLWELWPDAPRVRVCAPRRAAHRGAHRTARAARGPLRAAKLIETCTPAGRHRRRRSQHSADSLANWQKVRDPLFIICPYAPASPGYAVIRLTSQHSKSITRKRRSKETRGAGRKKDPRIERTTLNGLA